MKIMMIGGISLFATLLTVSAGVPEGKALFASKCQACHGPNGEGKAAIAKMFNVTMHPLGSSDIQSKPDADINKTITAGHGKMKPVTGLTAQQTGDIVQFVRSLKQ